MTNTEITQNIGPAGLQAKPHKPRCNFGHGHLWVTRDGDAYQCTKCGAMDSEHNPE